VDEKRPTHIEWTGAGGDYYLAVVVDECKEVITEFWGTRHQLREWMNTSWPELPGRFVPMALSSTRRHVQKKDRKLKRVKSGSA
jgi:hypothetical protein